MVAAASARTTLYTSSRPIISDRTSHRSFGSTRNDLNADTPPATVIASAKQTVHAALERLRRGSHAGPWAALIMLCCFGVYMLVHAGNDNLQQTARRKQDLVGFSASRLEKVPPELHLDSPHRLSIDQLLAHTLLTSHKTPTCTLLPPLKERYEPLAPSYGNGRRRRSMRGHALTPHDRPHHTFRYFVALNLYDSEQVVPSLVTALYSIFEILGPDRFFISVYENGSSDTTPAQLVLFSRILEHLGVGYRIVSSTKPKAFAKDTRIAGLAELRNSVLRPLYEAKKGTWDRVLFINDIHVCEADLLEMMLQHEVQGADQSCAMDYKELRIKEFAAQGYPLLFYDVWVARDMLGLPFYKIKFPSGDWDLPTPPLPHSPSRFRSHSLLPFQVYSCFNGITILDASIFSPPHTIRFRSINGTDEQSECFLLSQDLWSLHAPVSLAGRKGGRGAKIQVVPRAGVAYDLADYERARQDGNVTAFETEDKREAMEKMEMVQWTKWPPRRVASYPRAHWNEEAWIPPF